MIEEITNLGSRNNTFGMELVILRADSLQEIIDSPIYHLNPSTPGFYDGDIYGVKGTAEQYADFYRYQAEAQISKQVVDELGEIGECPYTASREQYLEARAKVAARYKPWWEEYEK